MKAGGARPERVRIWLIRATARPAAGECGCASKTGRLTGAAVSACGPEVVAAVVPGNDGQVEGAVKAALPGVVSAIVVGVPLDIAQ